MGQSSRSVMDILRSSEEFTDDLRSFGETVSVCNDKRALMMT